MAVGDPGYPQGEGGLFPFTKPEQSGDLAAVGFTLSGKLTAASQTILANSGINSFLPDATLFPNFSASIALTHAGRADTNINVIGESTVVGTGSGTGGGLTDNAFVRSEVAQLVRQLNNLGIRSSADSFFGEHAIGTVSGVAAVPLYARQLALAGGATFAADASLIAPGGIPWQLNAGGKIWSFTPLDVADRVDVSYFITTAGAVTPTYGGAATIPSNITEAAATGVVKTVTLTLPRGTSTLDIPFTSGNFLLVGVGFWDSLRPRCNIKNMGINGLRLDQMFTSTLPFAAIATALQAIPASLTIVNCAINSAALNGLAGIPLYKTNLSTLIDTLQGYNSDVLLKTPNPIGTGVGVNGVLAAYAQAIREVGAAKSVQVADLFAAWVDYPTQLALGRMGDSTHPNALGYDAAAQLTIRALMGYKA